MNNSSRTIIRQPSAMRSHVPKKVTFGLRTSETSNKITIENSPAVISDMKVVKVANNPLAEIVYWTEHGPDEKGRDILFPEYKVLCEAFKGGYGWYDITEGDGRHLLPKPRPFKIVHISAAELKVIRAAETQVGMKAAQELAEAQRAQELAEAQRAQELAEAQRAQELAEADERRIMASEDAYAQEVETQTYINCAVISVMNDIRSLPTHFRYQEYLVDYISEKIMNFKDVAQDKIAEQVCKMVEKENLLSGITPSIPDVFTSQINSDDLPKSLELPRQKEQKQEQHPLPLYNLADIQSFFNVCKPFSHVGYKYIPFVNGDGRKMFVPEIYIMRIVNPSIPIPTPLPPLFAAIPNIPNFFDLYNFLMESCVDFADEVFIPNITLDGLCLYVPQSNTTAFLYHSPLSYVQPTTTLSYAPPAPRPYYSEQDQTPYIKCTNAYCQVCHPLPIINAVLLTASQPPNTKIIKTITMLPPPQVRTKKVRMPRMKRLRQLIG